MPLSETQYTPPYAEPISVDEMKIHLRLESTFTDDDALVTSLIKTAREYVETFTQRQLVAATWKLYLNQFPQVCSWWNWESGNNYSGRYRRWLDDPYGVDAIRLGHAPLMGVTSIAYVDTDGATQTLATSVYTVDKNTEPARIVLAYGQSWPSTRPQMNAVTVTYIAGFATSFVASANLLGRIGPAGGMWSANDLVRVANSGGALPAGLVGYRDYTVASFTSSVLTLNDGGDPVVITTAGTGTHYAGEIPESIRSAMKLLCGEMYENREASTASISKPTMDAVDRLLWPFRVMEMA